MGGWAGWVNRGDEGGLHVPGWVGGWIGTSRGPDWRGMESQLFTEKRGTEKANPFLRRPDSNRQEAFSTVQTVAGPLRWRTGGMERRKVTWRGEWVGGVGGGERGGWNELLEVGRWMGGGEE